MLSIARLIPSGSGWLIGASALTSVSQGIYVLILARALGAEQFGLFSGALALTAVFASVAGLGGGHVMVMRVSRAREVYRKQFGAALFYVSLTLIPLATLVLGITALSGERILLVVLPLLISELVFSRVFDLGLQSFQSHDRLQGNALFTAGAALGRLAVTTIFVSAGGQDAMHWAIAYTAYSGLLALLILLVSCHTFGRPRWSAGTLRTAWKTGMFFSLGMASRSAYSESDKFLLLQFELAQDAGQYSVAHRLMGFAFVPIQMMIYAANTRLYRAGAAGFQSAWIEMKRLLILILAYSALAAVGLILCAPVLPLLLGESYARIPEMAVYFAPIVFSQGMHYLFGDALMGLGKQVWRSVCQAAIAVASIVANILLIPHIGWQGAALVALVSSFALALILAAVFAIGYWKERRSVVPEDWP